jgi:hypothetical protein
LDSIANFIRHFPQESFHPVQRLLILISIIPILITFAVRWWLGIRLLKSNQNIQCRCDLEKWKESFGEEHLPAFPSGDLITVAELFRKTTLTEWRMSNPKAAASRESTRRFGVAVPPLTAMVVILGMLVGRIPPAYGIAGFLLATAFTAVLSYVSIAPEIHAILTSAKRLRASGACHRRDDEDALIQLAIAISWKEAAPPIFNLLQR